MRQGIKSILSPKKQRRPLPFLLYKSFFYVLNTIQKMQYCTPAGGEKQVSFRKMLFRVYCVHCTVHVETMFSLPYIKPRLTLFYFPSKLVMAVSNIYSPQFPDFYSSITLSSSSPLHLFSFVITLSCLHIFLLVLRQAQNVFHTHISP